MRRFKGIFNSHLLLGASQAKSSLPRRAWALDRAGNQNAPLRAKPKPGERHATAPFELMPCKSLLAGQGYCLRPFVRCGNSPSFLSLNVWGRPLFLEGEAGVGKTEIAKALALAAESAN